MENYLFEKAPIHKAYFKLSLPVVFSMVVSLVYNMVDTYFIAHTQNVNIVAGVSICAPIMMLLIAIGDIFGIGGSSVISRLFGQKKDEEGRKVSGYCFYAAIVTGIIVILLLLLLKNPVLTLLGANQDTYTYASSYYFYLSLGAPFIILSIVPGNLMRTEGFAMEAMIGTVIGSIVNIILDPIFIFTLNMGAGGAAIATVIGNIVTDIILVYFILKKSKKLTVSWKETKIEASEKKNIFSIGIPASVTNLMQSISVALMNNFLVFYGNDKVAAMGIALKVNMIMILIMVGFAFGAQPLIGYNYGANNINRLRKIIRFDIAVEMIFAIVVGAVLFIGSKQVLGVFMDDPGIIEAGSVMLRFLLISTPFAGVVLVFTTVFQAYGKALPAFVLSISRQGIVFAVCLFILSKLFGYQGVILSQTCADVMTGLLAIGMYLMVEKKHNK